MALTPQKSAEDEREYRLVTLENKLTVLLIHDAEADMAAAAMDVKVGHFSDPEDLPGLAHFLEHMLFLGTEKYPDESSYNTFLNSHGGFSNAFTATENTNYMFEVAHDHLKEALDRFAQFFIQPLFTPSATDREMQAVNSENAKNLNNDFWRVYQLEKSTSNPDHPFHKFGTGNLETLKDTPQQKGLDVPQELVRFYERYYSSNVMKLVILGRESLDALEVWAKEMFSAVPNRNLTPPAFPGTPVCANNQQVVIRLVPVKDLRYICLSWFTPPTQQYYRSKPDSLLAHIIGHEGPGSILALLKRQGLANELVAGGQHSASGFASWMCRIDLTEEGLDRWEEVAETVFSYIKLLRDAPSSELRRVYDEVAGVSAMNFRFSDKETPFNYTSSLARKLNVYPAADVLTAQRLFFEYDEKAIRLFLDSLTVSGCSIMVASKTFEGQTAEKERWYETEYTLEPMKSGLSARLETAEQKKDLKLPAQNDFVATDFTLAAAVDAKVSDDTPVAEIRRQLRVSDGFKTPPIHIRDDAYARCWYKDDRYFLKPRSAVNCYLTTTQSYLSPFHAVMTDLYIRLVKDSLNEFTYDAECAGLHYDLFVRVGGLELAVYGYSEKLSVLLERVVSRMTNLTVDEERFRLIKEKLTRETHNFKQDQPYQHSLFNVDMSLRNVKWHYDERLAVLPDITSDDVRRFIPTLFEQSYAEILVIGNASQSTAESLCSRIVNALVKRPLYPSQHPEMRYVRLTEGTDAIVQRMGPNAENDENSALTMMWQIGEDVVRNRVLLDLFAQVINEPCFDQLRTKEQLGYLVWSGVMVPRGVLHLRVIVQSPDHGAEFLAQRVDAFISTVPQLLQDMTPEQFEEHRQALKAIKTEKPKRLSHERGRHWGEIVNQRYEFDAVDTEVEALSSISLDDLRAFFHKYIVEGALHRRRFISQINGKDKRFTDPRPLSDSVVYVDDFTQFRHSFPLFPHSRC